MSDQRSLFDAPVCRFCGGDDSSPNHWLVCDGRQGRIEARIVEAPPPPLERSRVHNNATAPEPQAPYPEGAGWKAPGTSAEAAATVNASTWRLAVRECLQKYGPMTTDECALVLHADVLTIRPRFSELRARHVIYDTGGRHRNASGKRAVVWALAADESATRRVG